MSRRATTFRPDQLTGPQRVALFFLRDKTLAGGAYVYTMTATLSTLRVLYRLKLIEGDLSKKFKGHRFVMITPAGRDAIYELPQPSRSR